MMTPSALLMRSLKATHSGLGFFIRLSRWSNNGKLHSIRSRISGRSCPLDSIKLWKNNATRWLLRFLRTLEEIIIISAILYWIDFVINLKFWIGGSYQNFHYISNIKVNILNDTSGKKPTTGTIVSTGSPAGLILRKIPFQILMPMSGYI